MADRDDVVVEHAGVDRVRDSAARTASRAGASPCRRATACATPRASAARESARAPARGRSRGARTRRARRRGRPRSRRAACDWRRLRRRVCGAAGSGSCTTKRRASAKIARRIAVVVGASSARWKCERQVGGREMHAPVGGVGATGSPSRRWPPTSRPPTSTPTAAPARRGRRARARRHRCRAKPSARSACSAGPLVRRQHRLRQAARRQRAHLGQALQRRLARIRDLLRVALGREVALREARVVVRRTGDAVEVDSSVPQLIASRRGRNRARHAPSSPGVQTARSARPRRAAGESGRRARAPPRRSRGNRRSGDCRRATGCRR